MDEGPIIIQAAVPVRGDDTADTLAERVLAMEHRCYPLAVRWMAEGRVRVTGATVRIEGAENPAPALINPVGAGAR
jgi:phosphoribosylglycinamide formyltransferase-1